MGIKVISYPTLVFFIYPPSLEKYICKAIAPWSPPRMVVHHYVRDGMLGEGGVGGGAAPSLLLRRQVASAALDMRQMEGQRTATAAAACIGQGVTGRKGCPPGLCFERSSRGGSRCLFDPTLSILDSDNFPLN